MKKYLMIAAAVLTAAALVSCNPDNEAGGGGGGATVTVFETKDATTVCINEVNGGDGYKGIELYNPTSAEVSLVGWKIIKNDETETPYWEGVEGDKIAAGGFLVIRANKSTASLDALDASLLSVNKASGGLSGKKIVKLVLINGELSVDTFDRGWTKHWDGTTELGLPDAGTNSFARNENGKKTWKIKSPTFGATNAGGEVIGDVTVDPE